jgi:hypothetical protein
MPRGAPPVVRDHPFWEQFGSHFGFVLGSLNAKSYSDAKKSLVPDNRRFLIDLGHRFGITFGILSRSVSKFYFGDFSLAVLR